jgi:formylglycine-generating enzyme required for sulfatase activity
LPSVNTQDDGWLTAAPVRSYRPNAYGLWQTVGNVWEWCNDWWNPDYYAVSPSANPAGPASVRRGCCGVAHICAMTRTATGTPTRRARRTRRTLRWVTRGFVLSRSRSQSTQDGALNPTKSRPKDFADCCNVRAGAWRRSWRRTARRSQ